MRQFIAWVIDTPARPSPCTHFEDLAVRMQGQHRSLNLVITDGLFDCPPAVRGNFHEVLDNSKIIVLMVPTVHENPDWSEETRFRGRERDILRLFPSAVILRPYQIESLATLLEESLSTQTTGPGVRQAPLATSGPPYVPGNAMLPMLGRKAVATSSLLQHDDLLKSQVEADLRSIIKKKQMENVRLSWGTNLGECFTNQDLQEMISTRRALKVAESLKSDKSFLEIAMAAKKLPPKLRISIEDANRKALHKTWTERGIIDADGQTVAGVQAEIMIAAAIVDELQYLVERLPLDEIESLLLQANPR
ncbi:MAG TPA: hypothetical protein VNW97_09075 [Candidatus Saccharimonadales bacterium]|nr:hypothetical protein [Candidatus Saccharimonadales bacterium]